MLSLLHSSLLSLWRPPSYLEALKILNHLIHARTVFSLRLWEIILRLEPWQRLLPLAAFPAGLTLLTNIIWDAFLLSLSVSLSLWLSLSLSLSVSLSLCLSVMLLITLSFNDEEGKEYLCWFDTNRKTKTPKSYRLS